MSQVEWNLIGCKKVPKGFPGEGTSRCKVFVGRNYGQGDLVCVWDGRQMSICIVSTCFTANEEGIFDDCVSLDQNAVPSSLPTPQMGEPAILRVPASKLENALLFEFTTAAEIDPVVVSSYLAGKYLTGGARVMIGDIEARIVSPKDGKIYRAGPSTRFVRKDSVAYSDAESTTSSVNLPLPPVVDRVRELLLLRFPASSSQSARLQPPASALLIGPGGSGRRTLAGQACARTGVALVVVDASSFRGRVGDQARAQIDAALQRSRTLPQAVLFAGLDELGRAGAGRAEKAAVVQTVLRVLRTARAPDRRLFVFGSSVSEGLLHPSLVETGRFDSTIVVGLPAAGDRQRIMEYLAGRCGLPCTFSRQEAGLKTSGYLPGDLVSLLRMAERCCRVREGTEVTDADLMLAMQRAQPAVVRGNAAAGSAAAAAAPLVWAEIAGMDAPKQRLTEAVLWPSQHKESFRRLGLRPIKGVLIFGPPGSGKTALARALCVHVPMSSFLVAGPELYSPYVGDAERSVRELFASARAAAPSIIFIDEIDALVGKRKLEGSGGSEGGSVQERVLSSLLNEMDGIEALGDVVVLAATNRPDNVDAALLRPGRMDELLYIGLPDAASREDVLRYAIARMPLAEDESLADVARILAAETAGFSGADIVQICRGAGLVALERSMTDTATVCLADFRQTIAGRRPTVSEEVLRLHEDFRAARA